MIVMLSCPIVNLYAFRSSFFSRIIYMHIYVQLRIDTFDWKSTPTFIRRLRIRLILVVSVVIYQRVLITEHEIYLSLNVPEQLVKLNYEYDDIFYTILTFTNDILWYPISRFFNIHQFYYVFCYLNKTMKQI